MEDPNPMQTRLVPGVGRLPYPAYRGKEPFVFVSCADDGILYPVASSVSRGRGVS